MVCANAFVVYCLQDNMDENQKNRQSTGFFDSSYFDKKSKIKIPRRNFYNIQKYNGIEMIESDSHNFIQRK